MAEIKPAEVTAILKQQLSGFTSDTQLEEVGTVLQVGDGIARIYGLNNVQSGELIEFSNGLQGIVLNLEEDNVGAVLLGSSNTIKEGDIFLLPPRVEHSPQRFPNTVGLVIERQRTSKELDACTWYCEKCDSELYKAKFHLGDIVEQLPKLLQSYYDDINLRTCKKCGTVMEIPKLKEALIK